MKVRAGKPKVLKLTQVSVDKDLQTDSFKIARIIKNNVNRLVSIIQPLSFIGNATDIND